MTLLLAFVAGALSLLAPCVLPLLPIILAGAAARHPAGPFALAAGLALSYAGFGIFVATIGFAIGLDETVLRPIGGALLVAGGLVLLAPPLQRAVAVAAGPLAARLETRPTSGDGPGLAGPFLLGVTLGLVWAPCVGPTLAAALGLAATGESVGAASAVMIAFGLGAAMPLALLGRLSQAALMRWRGRLAGAGQRLRALLGILLMVVGGLIVSGLDKRLEAVLVEASPAWLSDLAIRY